MSRHMELLASVIVPFSLSSSPSFSLAETLEQSDGAASGGDKRKDTITCELTSVNVPQQFVLLVSYLQFCPKMLHEHCDPRQQKSFLLWRGQVMSRPRQKRPRLICVHIHFYIYNSNRFFCSLCPAAIQKLLHVGEVVPPGIFAS